MCEGSWGELSIFCGVLGFFFLVCVCVLEWNSGPCARAHFGSTCTKIEKEQNEANFPGRNIFSHTRGGQGPF